MTLPLATPLCYTCRHYRGPLRDRDGVSCAAFPHGIPDQIISEAGDHRKPWEGDNGIQFELADGKALPIHFQEKA